MSSKLKPEPINRLTIKTGVVKGRKTNIKVEETKKSKKNFKNGVLSYDQKWRIYKSEIEPKLTDRVLEEEEPNNKMLDTIKEALKETNVNIGKILRDTKKEPTDTHSDIITPSHIDTTLRDKLASAAENRIRTKDATDKLEGIFKRRNVQTQFQNGFNEAERKNAVLVLEEKRKNAALILEGYVARNIVKDDNNKYLNGKSFKEMRKIRDDYDNEQDFLNKPINTGHIIEHQKELNKAVNKRKETLENKIKFGDVLNEIKSKEPKLVKNKITSLNDDITTLMKTALNKPKSIETQTLTIPVQTVDTATSPRGRGRPQGFKYMIAKGSRFSNKKYSQGTPVFQPAISRSRSHAHSSVSSERPYDSKSPSSADEAQRRLMYESGSRSRSSGSRGMAKRTRSRK